MFSILLPESERAVSDVQLIGLTGRVTSERITTEFGTARVQVPDGPELTVFCRVKPGDDSPVKDESVILINYEASERVFEVRRKETI